MVRVQMLPMLNSLVDQRPPELAEVERCAKQDFFLSIYEVLSTLRFH